MSLFPQETQEVSIPEQIRIIQMMCMNNKRSLDERKRTFTMNFRQFWRTLPLAQLICKELGTGAKEWFDESWEEQKALKRLDPTWEFLVPPYPFEIHEDGSVTITPEVPEVVEEITE